MIPLPDQIKELQEEIAMRHRVYGRYVEAGKMTAARRAEKIAAMEGALLTVQAYQNLTMSTCPHGLHHWHLSIASFERATITEVCCHCGQERTEYRPHAGDVCGLLVPVKSVPAKARKKKGETENEEEADNLLLTGKSV